MKKPGFRRFLAGIVVLAGITAVAAQQQTVGLFLNDDASYQGYTLFAPIPSRVTYLIDNHGKLVHSWASDYRPGQAAYLLESGSLLRAAQWAPGPSRFNAGGQGGRIEEFAWDGTLLWEFDYSSDQVRQHHDFERLPNGNVLLIAWEYKSYAECVAAGRSTAMLSDLELWPDHIVEIEPAGASGGGIVWEWHAWDHLVQDYDPSKENYGVVTDHPELIDLNFSAVGPAGAGKADWLHINAVDYSEEFDQIILSVHNFSEIWVIDHSTTTEEAAGHTGGNSGKGGDLLYRWGNPLAYDRGVTGDQKLFLQHDSQWIESGLAGEGNILIFNNGGGRPGDDHSTVDEIVPPVDEFGDYALTAGSAYGPGSAVWSYAAANPTDFYGQNTSGAQRLPGGNTLICDGPHGTFFEVTAAGQTVWRYVNPIANGGTIAQGDPATQNGVFRAYRYGPDHAAFDGRDLMPGDPIETFTRPIPVPGGEGGTAPLSCSKIGAAGDEIHVTWDATTCQADDYNLLFGDLDDVAGYLLQGSECAIGVSGGHDWNAVPTGDLFFLIVGVDRTVSTRAAGVMAWWVRHETPPRPPSSAASRRGTTR